MSKWADNKMSVFGEKIPEPESVDLAPVAVADGVAVCARWRVNGKHYFSDRLKNRAVETLKAEGRKCHVEELTEPAGFGLTAGVRYTSREEVIGHLKNNAPPESMKAELLQNQLDAAEQWIAALMSRVQEIESKQTKE